MNPAVTLALGLLATAPAVRAAGPADLIRLYEEEILAHDLYVTLGRQFPEIMPLRNIPRSEQMHRAALATVLKTAGIRLPRPPRGQRYATPGLDATFDQWLADGSKSAADACRAGVRLEDHDIAELRQAQLAFPAHRAVLERLEAASNQHLRAFHRNLTARGGGYTPEALTAADIDSILKAAGPAQGGCGAGGCATPPAPRAATPATRPATPDDAAPAQPKARAKRKGPRTRPA